MKIAFLPSADLSYDSGSVIFAKNYLHYLIDEKIDVDVLSKCDLTDSRLSRYVTKRSEILEHPIIDDRYVPTSEVVNSFMICLDFLVRSHFRKPIDIVHVQYFSFGSYAASVFKGLFGVPYIVSSYGRDLTSKLRHSEPYKKFYKKTLENVDRILVPDKNIANYLREACQDQSIIDRIGVVPQPLDKSIAVSNTGPEIKRENPSICTINSCFTPEKGIETTLKAFAMLVEKYPFAKLYVAGTDDHPEQINKIRLKDMVDKLGIVDSVVFTGYLDRKSVGELITSSDIFVDSRLKANFSSVLLEAQYLSAASISSLNNGSIDMIQDGRNGLLFEPGNYEGLYVKMRELIDSPEKRQALSDGARIWVTQNIYKYDADKIFRDILTTYNKLIGV